MPAKRKLNDGLQIITGQSKGGLASSVPSTAPASPSDLNKLRNNALVKQNKRLRAKLDLLHTEFEEQKNEFEQLQERHAEHLLISYGVEQEHEDALAGIYSSLSAQRMALKTELKETQAELGDVETENAALREEVGELRDEVTVLGETEEKLAGRELEIDDLKKIQDELAQEKENLCADLSMAEEARGTLLEEIAELKNDLKQAQLQLHEAQQTNVELHTLKLALHEANERNQALTLELQTTKLESQGQVLALTTELEQLKKQISQLLPPLVPPTPARARSGLQPFSPNVLSPSLRHTFLPPAPKSPACRAGSASAEKISPAISDKRTSASPAGTFKHTPPRSLLSCFENIENNVDDATQPFTSPSQPPISPRASALPTTARATPDQILRVR